MQILEDCGISYMFTTVDGGRSSAPFASANLGFHVGDNPSDVAYNRRRAQEKIGKPIVWMDQVHGARIAPVTGGKLGEIALDSYGFYSAGEADGMILERSQTPRSGLALAVMVADCVPVLLADVTGRRIAAIHMGRAGMEKNIVGKAIDLFIERGSRPENIAAWFGPHICGRCYEVDDDLAQRMPSAVRSLTRWGTPGIDIAYGEFYKRNSAGLESRSVRNVHTKMRTTILTGAQLTSSIALDGSQGSFRYNPATRL